MGTHCEPGPIQGAKYQKVKKNSLSVALSLGKRHLKTNTFALAGVAQRIEHQPVNQRVTSSIPSQGIWSRHMTRLRARSPVGGV